MVFLPLGTTAFGGPAAHISMMEDEFVRRRRWLTHEQFLDMLGAVNLIPGPNSTEMAIYVGYLRAGWMGLVLAGVCFILPAMAIVTAIAWAYVHFGTLPQVAGPLYGVKPVVIAVILQALWGLGRRAVKTRLLAVVAAGAIAANLLGADLISLLLAAGLLVALQRGLAVERPRAWRPMLLMLLVVAGLIAAIQIAPRLHVSGSSEVSGGLSQFSGHHAPSMVGENGTVPLRSVWPLFLYFTKVGSVLYGTGYVLLAFLQGDLVTHWHWLTTEQLLDATAVGQVTPGPLFTTATFIGYLKADLPGAVLATVGIFLPSFLFIAICGSIISAIAAIGEGGGFPGRRQCGGLALMAVVSVRLGLEAIIDWKTALLAIISGVLLLRYRLNSAWLVLGGAMSGFVLWAG